MFFSKTENEEDKINELAGRLREFYDEKYLQLMDETDDQVEAAKDKVAKAERFMDVSGLAIAFGVTIPRHIRGWQSDFENDPRSHYSYINASNVVVKRTKEKLNIKFSIGESDYKITLKENGYDEYGHTIKLTSNGEKVLMLELHKRDIDLSYLGVKYLTVGQWTQDILILAAEIEARGNKLMHSILDAEKVRIADNIFLDDD